MSDTGFCGIRIPLWFPLPPVLLVFPPLFRCCRSRRFRCCRYSRYHFLFGICGCFGWAGCLCSCVVPAIWYNRKKLRLFLSERNHSGSVSYVTSGDRWIQVLSRLFFRFVFIYGADICSIVISTSSQAEKIYEVADRRMDNRFAA